MARKEAHICPKCDGKGVINGFRHYADGVCFECSGARVIYLDPMTDAQKVQTVDAANHDAAVRALALKVGAVDGKYTQVGLLITSAHAEVGTWSCYPYASPGSRAARIGKERTDFYRGVIEIVDAACDARSIRPAQLAKLEAMAAEWQTFAERQD